MASSFGHGARGAVRARQDRPIVLARSAAGLTAVWNGPGPAARAAEPGPDCEGGFVTGHCGMTQPRNAVTQPVLLRNHDDLE